MIFDLVARATLNERYGLLSKPLRPFRDYAELECRGEDPRSLRALGFRSVRKTIRKAPFVPDEPAAPAEAPSLVELPSPFSIERA
ncbi:MAG: hypothetical protein L3J97_07490 [Thermoplasmata archaeon]|nr:hypothetical protein [Thermoplasmata archaeon]